ncbi:MAG: hypothetical protein A3E85_00655 [Gammaproteobacteria bacterium RIFCSPHIGHO2_12_FULL_45_12]|nr:MAG: hypothetical protein A3E85_00655 [Gammaproteobacteria bacterium RIFCSPHIGHO2_12_FULL_45_12]
MLNRQPISDEEIETAGESTELSPNQQWAWTAFQRFLQAISAISLSAAATFPLAAYPPMWPMALRVRNLVALPLCHVDLMLRAGDENKRRQVGGLNVNFKEIHRLESSIKAGTNTLYFSLSSLIALYLAIYAAVKNVGESEVDVSDRAYLLGFVLPTAFISAVHGLLDYHKQRWEQPDTSRARITKRLRDALSTLGLSGAINTVLMAGLSIFHLTEESGANPYVRVGLFATSGTVGTVLTLAGNKYPRFKIVVSQFTALLCAGIFLASIFSNTSNAERSEAESGILMGGFMLFATLAILSAKFFPNLSGREEERLPLLVRSSDGSVNHSQRIEVVIEDAEPNHMFSGENSSFGSLYSAMSDESESVETSDEEFLECLSEREGSDDEFYEADNQLTETSFRSQY